MVKLIRKLDNGYKIIYNIRVAKDGIEITRKQPKMPNTIYIHDTEIVTACWDELDDWILNLQLEARFEAKMNE